MRGIERALAGMAEGRMAEIVGKRQRLGQVLVDAKRARDRAGDLRHFEAVGEARAVMIALVIDEDLGLVVEPPEGGRSAGCGRGRGRKASACGLGGSGTSRPRLGAGSTA